MLLTMLLMIAQAQAVPVDLSKGPVATTNVAVEIAVDPRGRVVRCRGVVGGAAACRGFPKGRAVTPPLRRNGKPVSGKLMVVTRSVISPN